MKRALPWVFGVLIFLTLAVAIALRPTADSSAPRFIPGAPSAISPFKRNFYGWSASAPFEGDKIWMWTDGKPHPHVYLYDLNRKIILGELINGHRCNRRPSAGGISVKLGEQPDDLQPFDARQFAQALFEE